MQSVVLFLDKRGRKAPVENAVKAVELEIDDNYNVINSTVYFRDKSYFYRTNRERSLIAFLERIKRCHVKWRTFLLQ